jgi:hypothetical protein
LLFQHDPKLYKLLGYLTNKATFEYKKYVPS